MNKQISKSLMLDLQEEVKCDKVVKGNIQAEDKQGLEKHWEQCPQAFQESYGVEIVKGNIWQCSVGDWTDKQGTQ